MADFIYRDATLKDVPFLVETIIEAEKSGTDVLSYTTIFGLSEDQVRKYLADMLYEEVEGCELSVSSFLLAEKDGQVIAALSAWIEGSEGTPSSILKGNLLNYTLPKTSLERAVKLSPILKVLHIDYVPGTIQKGAGYVLDTFRGNNLLGKLTNEKIKQLLLINSDVKNVLTQIYGSNFRAIHANEKVGFKVEMVKESSNNEIMKYLPSNKKLLLKKEISTQ